MHLAVEEEWSGVDAQKTRAAAETHARRRRTETERGKEPHHARTHTGMKFSDTSFARWRHQVRRTRRLAVAGRGREGRKGRRA